MTFSKPWSWALGTLVFASAATLICLPGGSQTGSDRPTPIAEEPVHEPDDDATTEDSDPSPVDALTQERIDRWLEAEQLNEFGDPRGTLYLGGTPLFDETCGEMTDRYVFILERHPELGGCNQSEPVNEETHEESPVNEECPDDDEESSSESCEGNE